VTAASCEGGSYVTGIDGDGQIICSCPHTAYGFDITASEYLSLQLWPDTQLTSTDPNNAACSVTVETPYSNQSGTHFSNYISGSGDQVGWTVVGSTGYPAGTTFTIHVDNPHCRTTGSGASVVNNYPLCSNSSTVGASGESTDHATVTPN